MRLEVYRSTWGAVGPGEPWADAATFFPVARAAGYDGIELVVAFLRLGVPPWGEITREQLRDLLQEHALGLHPMIITGGRDFDEQIADLEVQLDEVAWFGATSANAHTGIDRMDDTEAEQYLRAAIALGAGRGIELHFETHRGRILFEPWRTARLLDRIDGLLLTADLSHWVVVAERLLTDEDDLLSLVCERTRHVHARVGFDEGPQVPDPRLARWAPNLEWHERWWDAVWRAAAARGDEAVTLTPEWGPSPYAPTSLRTGEQDVELAPIVDWMTQRQRDRFALGAWRA